MPVSAIRVVSQSRNGLSAFILPCKRLDFHYCDWAGSSTGMNEFLRTLLPNFARQHPSIEMTVSPRPRQHPIIRASYINGREKVVCVRKLDPRQIWKKAVLLRDASGEKLQRRTKRGVVSSGGQQSVRGVWSPFHAVGPVDATKLLLGNRV
ncbi:MAG: 39S ribosomal protein L51, mitochondrial [Phylliscum demangeonii]|nr:MAG: 39S ribosomal protein L51, mitochondrial [Phylliscum demangeonii]